MTTNTSRKWNVSSSPSLAPPFWLLLLCFSRSSWPFTCSKVDVFGGGRGLRSIACVRRVSPSSSILLFPTLTLHFLLRRIMLAFVVELPRTRGGFADRKRRQNTYPIHRLSSSLFCYLFEMFRKKIGDVAVHALFILAFSFQKILSRHGASLSFVLFHGWTDEEEEEE